MYMHIYIYLYVFVERGKYVCICFWKEANTRTTALHLNWAYTYLCVYKHIYTIYTYKHLYVYVHMYICLCEKRQIHRFVFLKRGNWRGILAGHIHVDVYIYICVHYVNKRTYIILERRKHKYKCVLLKTGKCFYSWHCISAGDTPVYEWVCMHVLNGNAFSGGGRCKGGCVCVHILCGCM